MTLKNRIAFVTGANRGIGRALTEALLAAGAAKVYAAARNPGSLPDFGDSRVVPVTLDITDPSQVADAAGFADDVDLLINNAGVLSFGGLADAAADDLRRDMEVNYFGTLDVVRAFLPTLKRSGNADIVNVASIVSFVSFPMLGGYSASKAALYSVTQGLRTELAPLGIRVHSVNPGPIDTDMNPGESALADALRAQVPLGRYGTSEEVAALTAFLAGPEAGFITGARMIIDGGLTA